MALIFYSILWSYPQFCMHDLITYDRVSEPFYRILLIYVGNADCGPESMHAWKQTISCRLFYIYSSYTGRMQSEKPEIIMSGFDPNKKTAPDRPTARDRQTDRQIEACTYVRIG